MSNYRFAHHKGADNSFVADGLRPYFEYRDLGIKDATNGDYVAHVIRAREGTNATGDWHLHDCTFQMVYVLKGWAEFEYEGEGAHRFEQGDCIFQRPGIRHRELRHSDDFEVLEIVAPGNFGTDSCDAPG